MQVDTDNPEFQRMVAELKKQLGQPTVDKATDYVKASDLSGRSGDFYAGMISTLIHCLDVEAQTSPEDQLRARHYGAMIVVLTERIGQAQS